MRCRTVGAIAAAADLCNAAGLTGLSAQVLALGKQIPESESRHDLLGSAQKFNTQRSFSIGERLDLGTSTFVQEFGRSMNENSMPSDLL